MEKKRWMNFPFLTKSKQFYCLFLFSLWNQSSVIVLTD